MLTTFASGQIRISVKTVPKLALRAYLAGLGAAAALIVSAASLTGLALKLVFG